jgi:flagella basal body P-ring formation protein FlgA
MLYSILILLTLLITPDRNLKSSIDEFLKNKLSGYDKYEFTIVKAPEISGKYEIKNGTRFNPRGSFIYIPIKIFEANSSIIQTYVTIKLKVFKTVCIVKNDIEAKNPITADNVELRSIDISVLRGTPVYSFDKLKGLRSKIKIAPGSVLLEEYLEDIPVINRGDRITALAISGNVKISTSAEARQDGSVGDIIVIETKDKKDFKAKIIDSKNVIIE